MSAHVRMYGTARNSFRERDDSSGGNYFALGAMKAGGGDTSNSPFRNGKRAGSAAKLDSSTGKGAHQPNPCKTRPAERGTYL